MLFVLVRTLAIAGLAIGTIFFFQGIGLLPGSFMTGRPEWAFIGAAFVGLAVLGLWLGRRAAAKRYGAGSE